MLTKDDFPAVTVEERRFLRNFATTDQIVEWAQQYAAKAIAAHTAKVLEDVEPVAWGIFAMNGNIRFWSCDKASADAQAAKTGGEVVGIYPAHTVAALAARVAELAAALLKCRDMVEHPDNVAFIDAALAAKGQA